MSKLLIFYINKSNVQTKSQLFILLSEFSLFSSASCSPLYSKHKQDQVLLKPAFSLAELASTEETPTVWLITGAPTSWTSSKRHTADRPYSWGSWGMGCSENPLWSVEIEIQSQTLHFDAGPVGYCVPRHNTEWDKSVNDFLLSPFPCVPKYPHSRACTRSK